MAPSPRSPRRGWLRGAFALSVQWPRGPRVFSSDNGTCRGGQGVARGQSEPETASDPVTPALLDRRPENFGTVA